MAGGDKGARLAQVLVIVALAAMLLGAVVLISAHDPYVEDVAAGTTKVVFEQRIPAWSVGARDLDATLSSLYGTPNATFIAEETTGTGKRAEKSAFVEGQVPDWSTRVQPGESWRLTLINNDNETIRVAGTLDSDTHRNIGVGLILVGVLGFVFYRIGMRRDDS